MDMSGYLFGANSQMAHPKSAAARSAHPEPKAKVDAKHCSMVTVFI